MIELDRGIDIDPTEGDALYREISASAAAPLDEDAVDGLMEIVAPGTPATR